MQFSEIKLPSNRKFGFFFTVIFLITFVYFFIVDAILISSIFVLISIVLFLVTIFKEDFLLPLNKLWMRFGFLIGIIVSPIVLGAIFFFLFTPIAIFMKLFGRDELCLKLKVKKTHWINYEKTKPTQSFKNQF
tara:strand:+ start:167 stop:565 length:399 start_codon:yes stop_codon:yes gene_type:complete